MAAILEKGSRLEAFHQNHKLFPLGWAPLLHWALTPEVSERWMSLYLQWIEEWDSHVSPLAPKAIRIRHLFLQNAPCPVSPFIHHRPYNVQKKYAVVSIIFHVCHTLSPPFVLKQYSSCNSFKEHLQVQESGSQVCLNKNTIGHWQFGEGSERDTVFQQ